MAPDRPVAMAAIFSPGEIVLADWRGDALPKEPNKRRPAVVVEDDLFPPGWPNVMLVPLTDDENLVIPDLAVRIDPTADNGCTKPCWAVSALLTTTSKQRVNVTGSKVRSDQLAAIRRQIALLMGCDG
ncbi:hypothetical protein AD936_21765 [Gluconobacter japonicus]|nr:hypothetical protein AD936_21765 [Gluconobacter japonicus]GAD11733.1 hypothetical protein GFGA_2c0058 [Gluconobacter frateurii NBRC 103465]